MTVALTEMPVPVQVAALTTPPPRHRRRGRLTMWIAISWLAFITISAIGANWLPYIKHSCDQYPNPKQCSTHVIGDLRKIEKPPAWAWFAHPEKHIGNGPERTGVFGTDRNGYDLFSRSMFGARNSLLIGVLAITFGLLFGTIFGMISGYYRGWIDRVIEVMTNILLAFPALLLAIFIVTFSDKPNSTSSAADTRSVGPIILALSILAIPPLTRLVRANTIMYSQREFVMAAKSIGAPNKRILFREILPNIIPTLLSFALTGLALLLVAEGALAALGLSVEAPLPTWGRMISAGQERLRVGIWWPALMPAIVMFLTILAINLLGDVLAERFNTREAIA
ncbi:MAG TPA: ABC transporter permease [Ilumatobacteraceae bacterium]